MPQDRVIHWPASTRVADVPTNVVLGPLCRDYTRGIATSVRWHRGRTIIRLPGECTAALRRVGRPARMFERGEPRTIEVSMGGADDGFRVYVTTRMADDITNAIAEGLAAIIAQHWRGEREAT